MRTLLALPLRGLFEDAEQLRGARGNAGPAPVPPATKARNAAWFRVLVLKALRMKPGMDLAAAVEALRVGAGHPRGCTA